MDSVTFVSPRYPPFIGGVETHVSELAKRAPRSFRRVSVITTDPSGRLPRREVRDGSTVYRIRSFAPNENYHFPMFPSLLRDLREARSEILHLHSIHDILGPLAAVFDNRSTLVLSPHFGGRISSAFGKTVFGAYRSLLAKMIDRVKLIICVSKFESGLMQDLFPASVGKIRIIPNGLDLEMLSSFSWQEPDTDTILFVGRLEKYKNVDKLLQAFAIIRDQGSNAKLTIVGKGPARNELVELARRLKLEQRVGWAESLQRSELYRLYASSSVVVLPSDLEAYGIVAAEAIAIGTPTIVEDSSALSEFVEAGLAIPVEPPVDPQDLAVKISEVLEHPRSFSRKTRAAEIIHSWDEIAARTFDNYRSISN